MRQDKQLLLDEIKDEIDSYESFVIMRYSKLTANAANNFRREVARLGGSVAMVRKRVLIKAAKEAGVELELASLPGHIGLVFAKDPIETTKFVIKFGEEDKHVEVVGGRFEGQMYSGADVAKLATLPNKDEMRAQLLATFEAPMSQTLAVMEALLTSVVYCLDNKTKLENPETETNQ
jgi:large subunit ribosomal protein L10